MGCFVVREFLLTTASRGPSAIAEPLVIWGPIHISGMAEARSLKFCTKEDYIKPCQRDDISPIKERGFAHVTHFCMQSCGVRKKSPRHSVICDQQCPRRWTTDYHSFSGRRALPYTIRFKLRRFDLLPREAMLSTVYAVVMCLCVCLSVCVFVWHTPVLYENG